MKINTHSLIPCSEDQSVLHATAFPGCKNSSVVYVTALDHPCDLSSLWACLVDINSCSLCGWQVQHPATNFNRSDWCYAGVTMWLCTNLLVYFRHGSQIRCHVKIIIVITRCHKNLLYPVCSTLTPLVISKIITFLGGTGTQCRLWPSHL